MAFWVPLLGCAACPGEIGTKLVTAIKKESTKRCMRLVSLSYLLSGFVRMIAREIEKTDFRIFVLIDVGVRRLVIGDVVERHPGCLPAKFIADKSKAGAFQGSPDLLNVVMIDDVRTAHRQRIERHDQHRFQGSEAILREEERFVDVSPMAIARGDRNPVSIPYQQVAVGPETCGNRFP